MQRAKDAVHNFIAQDGKHTTTVHEDSRAAVTEEHVRPEKHENVTTAVDKEVHQDHHHTTVQPIKAKEVLPEQHHHNVAATEHKTFHHGNKDETRATLDKDAARFQDSTTTHDTKHTASTAPVVEGEHVHHHVHEHIQPVIQKETIAPEVVHTTVPIHETHHAQAVHHGTSVLPTKTLDEFNGKVPLEARATHKVAEYEGCPSEYDEGHQTERRGGDKNLHQHSHQQAGLGNQTGVGANTRSGGLGNQTGATTRSGGVGGVGGVGSANAGPHSSNAANKADPRVDSDRDGRRGVETGSHNTTTGAQKPSLVDRINPFKDTDGDGKKGIMD